MTSSASASSSLAATAAAFAQHVELDEGVLATSAPLETAALERVLRPLVDALRPQRPDLAQRVAEVRDRLLALRVIGAAEAVASLLELLAPHAAALEFFKAGVVHVLTGEPVPTPGFGGPATGSKPAASSTAPKTTTTNGHKAPTPAVTPSRNATESAAKTGDVVMSEAATATTATTTTATATATPVAPPAPATVIIEDDETSPPPPATPAPPTTTATTTANGAAPQRAPVPAPPSPCVAAAPPVPTPAQHFAPLPSSGSAPSMPSPLVSMLRKRSMDSTYSSSGEQPSTPDGTPERPSKKSAKRKMAPGSDAHTSALHGQSYKVKNRDDPSLNPILSVPTHWEEPHYKPVQVINVNAPGAKDLIAALRLASTPFLLEGFSGWMKFASDWVLPNGSLDSEAFLRGLHEIKVPVIEKNYEDTNPIKTHLPLAHYVRNYWDKGKSDYYMHQWQFPLTPRAAKLLCYKCDELPVIGDNLLLYWLDSVRGDNPLQYFFMGQRSTSSRMHQDPGGLDIMIAPIVGTKRVTMLHKSAAKIDSVHEHINFHDIDLDKTPLLAFIPAWRVDIKPGQILFMPEGTFHSCENMTACLSYHRFHVDAVNMPGFLASFMAQDSPSINHAEILWNAVHDVMGSLEVNYHANGNCIDNSVQNLRKLDTLRSLRHASRVLSLEEAVPTGDSWDWRKLLEDIDDLLVKIDPTAPSSANGKPPKKKQRVKPASATSAADAVEVLDSDEEEDTAGASGQSASAKAAADPTSTPVANALALGKKTLSSHWDELALKVGDTIGVQVFERRNKARVLKIATNVELVQVHYVDWGSIYDEFLPLSSLYQRSTRSSKRVPYRKAPKVHESVLAKWGSTGQMYNAIVLKVIRSNACYVHYLKYENDWDQWVLPGHIFKKYAKDAAATAADE